MENMYRIRRFKIVFYLYNLIKLKNEDDMCLVYNDVK